MTASNIAEFKQASAPAVAAPKFSLSPTSFEQVLTLSDYLAESDMVPKDFKGKPGNCLVAIQWGMEIGLQPLQAMQNIAVINGRPSLWGDAVIALARSSPACEYIIETQTATEATCRVKRRGEAEQVRTFSMMDAKLAGLSGKQGPWTQYPKRMMQMRARAFAIRDVFPDVLKGLPVAEEVMDMPRDMGAADIVQNTVDVAPYLSGAKATKTDAEAATYWKEHNGKFAKQPTDHQTFKDAVIAHRLALKNSRTVDMETGEVKGAATTATKSFDEVMAGLCGADNLDALYVWGEWIETLDAESQGLLNAKFDEIKATLEGGAA